jgi:hypothetical protein
MAAFVLTVSITTTMAKLVRVLSIFLVCAQAVVTTADGAARPANDDFSAATVLQNGETVTNRFQIATVEPGEPDSYGYETLWYTFTAARSGMLVVQGDFSANTKGYVAIYQGTELENLTRIPWYEYHSSDYKMRAERVQVEEGVSYKIAAASWAAPEERTIILSVVGGHPHEGVENANELSGMFAGWTNKVIWPGAEVWARWTAPETGTFKLVTLSSGGGTVYRKSNTDLQRISGIERRSATFSAVANETYYLRLNDDGAELFGRVLRLGPLASNETPTSATKVAGTNVVAGGQNWTANSLSESLQGTVWWEWIAPATGFATWGGGTHVYGFHNRVPTVHSNVMGTNIFAQSSAGKRLAVTKGVTYRFGVKLAPSTNVTFTLDFEEELMKLGSPANSLLLGERLWHVQGQTFFSAPEALQAGPITNNEEAAMEMMFFGSGTLKFRTKVLGRSGQLTVSRFTSGSPTVVKYYAHDWTARTMELGGDCTVVRWTLSGTEISGWLDDIEFPQEGVKAPEYFFIVRDYAESPALIGIQSAAGRQTAIEVSTNLVDWTLWRNFTSPTTMMRYIPAYDAGSTVPQFYRARVTPGF